MGPTVMEKTEAPEVQPYSKEKATARDGRLAPGDKNDPSLKSTAGHRETTVASPGQMGPGRSRQGKGQRRSAESRSCG